MSLDQMLIGGIIVGGIVAIVEMIVLVIRDADKLTDYNDEDYWNQ